MRFGKKYKDVEVAVSLHEMPSVGFSLTCVCSCGAIWKLSDALYCPDCGGSHTYEIIDPIEGYALEG